MGEASTVPGVSVGGELRYKDRSILWIWVLAGSATMALYGLTMAPDILWGDSGDAQLRVLTDSIRGNRSLARSHCTYYAVAVAIRNALNMESARAANLTAALAGAATVANFAALVARMVTTRAAMIAATVALMCSHTLWQMSTGAEVVTFYTMFLTAELLAMLYFCQSGRGMWIAIAALMNGLALSAHNFAMLLGPAYGVVLAIALRRRVLSAHWLGIAIVAWGVGASPLIVLAAAEYGQVGSAGEVLRSLLFGRFQSEVLSMSTSLRSIAQLMAMTIYNVPTPLLLAAPIGLVAARSSLPRPYWYFVTGSGVILLVFTARYNVADQYTFMVPFYIVMTVFIALGIDRVLRARPSRLIAVSTVALAALSPIVYAATPALVRRFIPGVLPASAARVPYREPYDWFFQPWRRGNDGASRFAFETLDVLPPNAFLFVLDTMRPPLDYLQGRDARRLDVYLSYSPYDWPERKRREINRENTDAMVNAQILHVGAPVKGYIPEWLLGGEYRFIQVGPVFRVVHR